MTEKAANNQLVVVRQATPTIDTAAYTAADLMGSAAWELKNALGSRAGMGGLVQSVDVFDKSGNANNLEIWLFDSLPSTDFSAMDNSAFTLDAADWDSLIGIWSITEWYTDAAYAQGQESQKSKPFVTDTGSIWGVIVNRGGGTYGATDLTIRVGLLASTLTETV